MRWSLVVPFLASGAFAAVACTPDGALLPAGCRVETGAEGEIACGPETLLRAQGSTVVMNVGAAGVAVATRPATGPSDGEVLVVRPDGDVRELGTTVGNIIDIALTDSDAFWTTSEGAAGVQQLSLTGGGAPTTLVSTTNPSQLVLRSETLFWTGSGGSIHFLDPRSGEVDVIPVPAAVNPVTYAVAPFGDDGFAFARQFDSVINVVGDRTGAGFTVVFDGGPAEDGQVPWAWALAVQGTYVHFVFQGRLYRAPLAGNLPAEVLVADVGTDVRGMVCLSDWVIWTERERGALRAINARTRSLRTLAKGLAAPAMVRQDGDWIYWVEEEAGSVRKLSRLALGDP